jgi:RND family efflux transporter MFP subunit
MKFVSHHMQGNAVMASSIPTALKALAAVSLLPLLAACQDQAISAVAKPERPVQVQQVSFRSDSASREFVGVVRARHETDLGFRVAGKITDRIVNAGDRVRTGDLIARLDPEDLRLQVASAEAEISAAKSNFAQASSDEERFTSLKARGYAAVADYERKKSARDEAESRLERARRSLELARNQLAYAELRANADGVITATLAEPGQVVAIGQAVVRLAQQGEMEAAVALPETWLTEARQSKANVRMWSGPARQSFSAHLRELSPQADPSTRTYAARFTIEQPDDAVALGMTAMLTLSHPAPAVAKLPLAAVLDRGTGPSVYVVDNAGMLELRRVEVASFTGDAALLTAGVHAGERVVTLGVQKLGAGQKVRVVEAH